MGLMIATGVLGLLVGALQLANLRRLQYRRLDERHLPAPADPLRVVPATLVAATVSVDRKVTLLMILDTESWMNVRRFRALHAAGATYAEIARECGCDWRTVRKYLAQDAPSAPPAAPSRVGS